MPTTTYYTATTLDGYIADPSASLAWLFRQEQDTAGPLNAEEFIAGIGATVMGSTTYEWLQREEPDWTMPQATWVMTSRSLPPDPRVQFAAGDVRTVHAEMASVAGDKGIWVCGGGDLAGQFADAGLLDELIVYAAPVVLGAGRPLLPRRLDLELLETHRNGAFVASRYRVLGPLTEDQ
ncbi:MAG TPA: dihydrofolate reductase family protein [Aeromicrobium sp.]|nr:dihydrofolate reductase family protein [Aeromicrobium sp.]